MKTQFNNNETMFLSPKVNQDTTTAEDMNNVEFEQSPAETAITDDSDNWFNESAI